MTRKANITLTLEVGQIEFLERKREQYGKKTVSEVVRALLRGWMARESQTDEVVRENVEGGTVGLAGGTGEQAGE